MEPFRYWLRVRYSECDAQQVVFNARYGDYVDIAGTEYYRALWGGYDRLVARGLETQVVRYLIEWKASSRSDERIAISVTTHAVGRTSFTLIFTLFGEDGRLRATAEAVYVMVDAKAFTPVPVPEDIRASLLAGAPGVVTDHSGGESGRTV